MRVCVVDNNYNGNVSQPQRRQHQQIQRTGHRTDRQIRPQRPQSTPKPQYNRRRLHTPPQESRPCRQGRDRQIADAAATGSARISARSESDNSPCTPGSVLIASASSTAMRGPPPRRPHCQTRTFMRPRARSDCAHGSCERRGTQPRLGHRPAPRTQRLALPCIIGEPPQLSRLRRAGTGSAHSAPTASNTPRGSRAGTSR